MESKEQLNKWVYLEKDSLLFPHKGVAVDKNTKVIHYANIQRAIGIIEGNIIEWNEQTNIGEMEIEGNKFSFRSSLKLEKKSLLPGLIGKPTLFSFWPSLDEIPEKKGRKLIRPEFLQICSVFQKPRQVFPGYVEVIGKLHAVWSNELMLSLWSREKRKEFYIPIAGEYPYPDEVGSFVWVEGKFDAKAGVIRFVEANAIAFLDQEESKKLKEKVKEPKFRKVKKYDNSELSYGMLNKFTPNVPVSTILIAQIQIPNSSKGKLFNQQKMEMLKEAYKKNNGPPKPIIVKSIGQEKYAVVDGNRRVLVAQSLGYDSISAYVLKE